MPLVDFEWEDGVVEVEDVGPCFVCYARDTDTGQWYRVAVELKELENVAQRKAMIDGKRKH